MLSKLIEKAISIVLCAVMIMSSSMQIFAEKDEFIDNSELQTAYQSGETIINGDEGLATAQVSNTFVKNITQDMQGEGVVFASLNTANTTEFLGGSGTESDPYLISNKTHLNNVRNHLDAHFKLMCDILNVSDFNMIGSINISDAFTGVFDGNGFCISGLNIVTSSSYTGLFANNKGTIKNLGIAKADITGYVSDGLNYASTYKIGILAGYNQGTIENCYTDGCIFVNAYYADVYGGTLYGGGIVGYNTGVIVDSYNSATINQRSGCILGGVSGYNSGTIANCYNNGAVKEPNGVSSDESIAGGIVGMNENGIIKNCYNSAPIKSCFSIGGIAGTNRGTIKSCYNIGEINSCPMDISFVHAGGIAGQNYSFIEDCYNTAEISATAQKTNSVNDYYGLNSNAGGIVGTNYGSITKCHNSGAPYVYIFDQYKVCSHSAAKGGIVGCCESGSVNCCYNTGKMPGNGDYTGGIIGFNKEAIIENCYNLGEISITNDYAGGIVGLNNNIIKYCYNVGVLFSTANGDIATTYGKFGEIDDTHAGEIAGKNNAELISCYYLKRRDGVGLGTDNTIPCTDEQLRIQKTFENFDFSTVWSFDETLNYPFPILQSTEHLEHEENITEFSGGNGTVHNPYKITTAEQFYNIINYRQSYFKLMNDISFKDTEFQSLWGTFYGCFDGNGFSFKDIKLYDNTNYKTDYTNYDGLLEYNCGIIKNLNLLDYNITKIFSASCNSITFTKGGFVGKNCGIVENCSISGTITIKVYANSDVYTVKPVICVGGIVGENCCGEIVKCRSNVSIVDSVNARHEDVCVCVGGITGHNNSILRECYNTKTISSSSIIYASNGKTYNKYVYVGGISGKNENTILSCCNTAEINSDGISGGITGYSNKLIENSNNSGEISAMAAKYSTTKSLANAGGIVGDNYGTITKCYNNNTVLASATACAYAGGISGHNYSFIDSCYSTNNVTADTQTTDDYAYAGGIAGQNEIGGSVKNCYNTGDISATTKSYYGFAGGIVGDNLDNVSTCYSIGSVNSKYFYGAIVARNLGSAEECYYLDLSTSGVGSGIDRTVSCTDIQMKKTSTFAGFDFSYTWHIDSDYGYEYPQLIFNYQEPIKSVIILTQPIVTTFVEGSSPNISGATIKIIYDDGTEKIKNLELFMIPDLNIRKVGKQNITVKIGKAESNDTVYFEAIPRVVSSIAVTKLPTKINYVLNQPVNFDDGEVTLYFNDNTTEKLKLSEVQTSFDRNATGIVTVNVNYRGFTDTFDITINDRIISNIKVTGLTDLYYCVGQEINIEHGIVEITFVSEDNYTESIALEKSMISGYDKTKAQSQAITVTYMEKQTTFEVVVNEHTYVTKHNDTSHWNECTICNNKTNTLSHIFDNDCDTTCNVCGSIRTVGNHIYDNDCDPTCNICDAVRIVPEHVYTNDCDATCNVCGLIRAVGNHIYDNDCDPTCNICDAVRIVSEHVYTNDCDATCNVCGLIRAVGNHVYDNDCDPTCNICGTQRSVNHSFGNYVYNNDATYEKDGTKTRICIICNHRETIDAEGTKLKREIIDSSNLFSDVNAKAWYKPYIDYVVTYGLLNGTGNGKMEPDKTITRAEFVQVLANLSEIDTSNKNVTTNFKDVKSGAWYASAVKWAAENEIVYGISVTEFAPDNKITREQMCVMLVRYIENYLCMSLEIKNPKKVFADDVAISSFARDSIYKCQMGGLVSGVSETEFAPKHSANRASVAKIITKFHEQYLKK